MSGRNLFREDVQRYIRRERRKRILTALGAWLVILFAAIGLLFVCWVALVAWLGVL